MVISLMIFLALVTVIVALLRDVPTRVKARKSLVLICVGMVALATGVYTIARILTVTSDCWRFLKASSCVFLWSLATFAGSGIAKVLPLGISGRSVLLSKIEEISGTIAAAALLAMGLTATYGLAVISRP